MEDVQCLVSSLSCLIGHRLATITMAGTGMVWHLLSPRFPTPPRPLGLAYYYFLKAGYLYTHNVCLWAVSKFSSFPLSVGGWVVGFDHGKQIVRKIGTVAVGTKPTMWLLCCVLCVVSKWVLILRGFK